jgi:hypothetical protein
VTSERDGPAHGHGDDEESASYTAFCDQPPGASASNKREHTRLRRKKILYIPDVKNHFYNPSHITATSLYK